MAEEKAVVMTDDELNLLVEQVRRIRQLADDADAVLYGISAIPAYDPRRQYKVQKAFKCMRIIKELVDTDTIDCGHEVFLTHDEDGKKFKMGVEVVCNRNINHPGRHFNGYSWWD